MICHRLGVESGSKLESNKRSNKDSVIRMKEKGTNHRMSKRKRDNKNEYEVFYYENIRISKNE